MPPGATITPASFECIFTSPRSRPRDLLPSKTPPKKLTLEEPAARVARSSGPRKQGLRINEGVWVWRQFDQRPNVRRCCSAHAIILDNSLHSSRCLIATLVHHHPHSHRHWPPCLPQSLPLLFPRRSRLLQAQKQLRNPRSSRLPPATSTTISSGPTPRSRTLPGDRQLSRHTQRYISPEKRREEEHTRLRTTTMNKRSLRSFTGPQALRP